MENNFRHRRFFDEHAENWDEDETPEKIVRLTNIFTELNLKFEGRVLDIGSGTGILVPIIKSIPQVENILVELDLSLEMLRKNNKRWEIYRSEINQLNADAQLLPFKDASFDHIICFAALPHVPDRKQVMKDCFRSLRKSGKFFILHLMGSQQLNRFHHEVGGAVKNDSLETVQELAHHLKKIGFNILKKDEKEDLYLILAQK